MLLRLAVAYRQAHAAFRVTCNGLPRFAPRPMFD